MDGCTSPDQWFDLLPPPEARWPRGGGLDRLITRLEQEIHEQPVDRERHEQGDGDPQPDPPPVDLDREPLAAEDALG
jgi:hypothetical protein